MRKLYMKILILFLFICSFLNVNDRASAALANRNCVPYFPNGKFERYICDPEIKHTKPLKLELQRPTFVKADRSASNTKIISHTNTHLIADGAITAVTCDKDKGNSIYRAILRIDRVKAGPTTNKIDFLFKALQGPSVLVGDKGEFTLKKKDAGWVLVSKKGSVFSGGMLPICK